MNSTVDAKVRFIIFLSLLSLNCFSSQERGGGDPDAIDFGQTMLKVSRFLELHNQLAPEIDMPLVNELTVSIYQSLNVPGRSKIQVVEQRPRDQYGVEKAAVFSLNPVGITLHRESWQSASPASKVILVTMEVLGMGGVTVGRYERSSAIGIENYNEILSIDMKTIGDLVTIRLEKKPTPKAPAYMTVEYTERSTVIVRGFKRSFDGCDTGQRSEQIVIFESEIIGLEMKGQELVFQSPQGTIVCAKLTGKKQPKLIGTGLCGIESEVVPEFGNLFLKSYFIAAKTPLRPENTEMDLTTNSIYRSCSPFNH